MDIKKAHWFLNSGVGGGVPARSPIEIFNPAIISWHRASVGVTLSGSDVNSVADQGGLNKPLTGVTGRKPTLITDEHGNNWFRHTAHAFSHNTNISPSPSNYTIFYVVKYTGGVPAASEHRMEDNTIALRMTISSPQGVNVPNKYAGAITGTYGPIPETVQLLCYQFNDPTKTMYVENQANGSAAYTAAARPNQTGYIGESGDGVGVLPAKMDWAERVEIVGTVTEAERNEMFAYFSSIYNSNLYQRHAWYSNGKTIEFSDETVVETGSGDDDYLAFPSICIDSSNRIHKCQTEGPNHNNNAGEQFVTYNRSSDGGYSWTSKVTVIPKDGPEVTGDDRMLYTSGGIKVTNSGRIILRFHKITLSGGSPTAVGQPWIAWSDDDGDTWETALVTNDYADPGQCSGPANPIEYNGKLYLFLYGRTTGSGFREVVVYESDDYLSASPTFSFLSQIMPATAFDPEEPEVIEIVKGIWVCLTRSDNNKTYHSFTWNAAQDWSQEGLTAERPIVYQSIGFNGAGLTPAKGIVSFGRESGTERTRIHYSQNRQTFTSGSYIDSRTGRYIYGKWVYHPPTGKMIGVYGVETGASGTGPTAIICTRWSEVNA